MLKGASPCTSKHSSVPSKSTVLILINILPASVLEELKQNLMRLICFYYCSATTPIFMFYYFLLLLFSSFSLLLLCFRFLLLLSISYCAVSNGPHSFHLFHTTKNMLITDGQINSRR